MADLKEGYVNANGIRFHYMTAGKGPLVLLLHGFPQFWYTWRKIIPELANDYQVVALDMRGYNKTDRPEGKEAYQPSVLADDIAGVIKALGHEKAHIVGHDWGGGVAWRTAMHHPEVVDKLVVINCPHPYAFAKALKSNFAQMKRSWYVFLFQLPWLPEWLYSKNPKGFFKKVFQTPGITLEDRKAYLEAMDHPGAYTAALNYYRAAAIKVKNPDKKELKIKSPTLVIWGEDDKALGKELTYDMQPYFDADYKVEYLPGVSHWVPEEAPEKVITLVKQFLKDS